MMKPCASSRNGAGSAMESSADVCETSVPTKTTASETSNRDCWGAYIFVIELDRRSSGQAHKSPPDPFGRQESENPDPDEPGTPDRCYLHDRSTDLHFDVLQHGRQLRSIGQHPASRLLRDRR